MSIRAEPLRSADFSGPRRAHRPANETLALLIAVLPLPVARGQTLDPDADVLAKALMFTPSRCAGSCSPGTTSLVDFRGNGVLRRVPLLLVAMKKTIVGTLAAGARLRRRICGRDRQWRAGIRGRPDDPDAAQLGLLLSARARLRIRARHGGLARLAALIAPLELSARIWTRNRRRRARRRLALARPPVPALVHASEGPLFVWLRASGSCWAFALLIVVMAGGRGAFARALALRPLVAMGRQALLFTWCT